MHIYIHTYIQTLYILCFLQTLQELFLFPLNKAHQFMKVSLRNSAIKKSKCISSPPYTWWGCAKSSILATCSSTTRLNIHVHSYLALSKPRSSISPTTGQHNREPCAVDTVRINHLLQLCEGCHLSPQLYFKQHFKFFHCLRTTLKAPKGMPPHFHQKL